jgi:outer membrane protein OmpA-like peptidoglycan-associated protein
MPVPIIQFGAIVAVVTTIAVLPAHAQQVIVTVTAVPKEVTPGTCTRIVTEVRDELNRQLTLENGTPLGWSSFEYASANGTDFEWRSLPSGEAELCAKPAAGAVTTQVTATIRGMPYNGATIVAVAPRASSSEQASAAVPPVSPAAVPTQPYVPPGQPQPVAAPAGAAPASASASDASQAAGAVGQGAAAGAAPGAAAATPAASTPAGGAAAPAAGAAGGVYAPSQTAGAAPDQGAAGAAAAGAAYAPSQTAGAAPEQGAAGAAAAGAAYAPPGAGVAQGAAGAAAPQPAAGAAAPQPAAGAAATQPAAPPPPQQVAAQPVKKGGGFFKKLGGHIKQRAAEVKAETSQNLTAAATQIVDTTFQTGTKLVASTTAEVTNTARLKIGGVGQKLMLFPQRGGGSADNLALAISSGRAVLPEIRFTPGTSVLEPSGRELVNRLGVELRNEMARAPGIRFEIYAHVDSGASAQVLSEERAGAVKAALANYADAKRLTALGYGASQPVPGVPGSRVEIVRCNDGQTQCAWR